MAWTLKRLNEEVDHYFAEFKAVDVDELDVGPEVLCSESYEVDCSAVDDVVLLLFAEVVLLGLVVAFTEELKELVHEDQVLHFLLVVFDEFTF